MKHLVSELKLATLAAMCFSVAGVANPSGGAFDYSVSRLVDTLSYCTDELNEALNAAPNLEVGPIDYWGDRGTTAYRIQIRTKSTPESTPVITATLVATVSRVGEGSHSCKFK